MQMSEMVRRLLLLTPTMSELRNRTFPPPPPRHPNARPPSPNQYAHASGLNVPPPPVHPSHPPLPPRPPPSPRTDAMSEYFDREPIPSYVVPPSDTSYAPVIQRLPPPVPPNRPGNSRSSSENVVESTSIVDGGPVGTPILLPRRPSDLPPSVSRTSSITGSPAIAPPSPPVHHASQARSLTADSAYEDTLSEKELRDLYDDEEIDRFLRLFSAVGCPSSHCQSTHCLHST